MAAHPKPVDWEAVERDYRAGLLSLNVIGRQHKISGVAVFKHAKSRNWQRDLTARVREAARIKVSRLVSEPNTQGQEPEIIEHASTQIVEVVRRHQRHMGKLASIAEALADMMQAMANGEQPPNGLTLGSRETVADALAKCSVATSKFVPLERRAYNMDEAGGGQQLEDALREICGR